MGIVDNILNKIRWDLEYKAGSEVSNKVFGIFKKQTEKPNKCPKCGTQITDPVLKFCPSCGAKLVKTCPKCKIDFPANTKFCTTCGKPLK